MILQEWESLIISLLHLSLILSGPNKNRILLLMELTLQTSCMKNTVLFTKVHHLIAAGNLTFKRRDMEIKKEPDLMIKDQV